ncbi:MAG: MogA/MoaB family molybdenum cofactor biosynthesis protein [Desulfurococcaceae archaeon]
MKWAIVVVSDSIYYGRGIDESGTIAEERLVKLGHVVAEKIILPNDYKLLMKALIDLSRAVDAIIVIGGTGPSPRDLSIDVVEKISWRKMPGFGEIFRYLTYQTEGAKAIFTRAELYLVGLCPVAVIPGSPKAVKLGLDLLIEAIPHIVEEAKRIEGVHKSL